MLSTVIYKYTNDRHFLFNQVYAADLQLRNGKVTAKCGQLFSRYLQIEQRNQASEQIRILTSRNFISPVHSMVEKSIGSRKNASRLTGKLQNRSDD